MYHQFPLNLYLVTLVEDSPPSGAIVFESRSITETVRSKGSVSLLSIEHETKNSKIVNKLIVIIKFLVFFNIKTFLNEMWFS